MTSARFMHSMLLYTGLLLLLPLGFCCCTFFCGFLLPLFFFVGCESGVGRLVGSLLLFICGTAGWGMAEWKGGHDASACGVQHRERLESGLLCVLT